MVGEVQGIVRQFQRKVGRLMMKSLLEGHSMRLPLVILCFFSVAFAQGPSATPPRLELFGGYSVNTDYIQNRPLILIVDQKVSPFFSLGSGPTGFEGSLKRYV